MSKCKYRYYLYIEGAGPHLENCRPWVKTDLYSYITDILLVLYYEIPLK